MKKLLSLLVFLVVPCLAFSQYARYDQPVLTINAPNPVSGNLYPAFSLPLVAVTVCSYPANGTYSNGVVTVPCTNYATTYTSNSGSPCPTNAQLTTPFSTTCTATADSTGNIGLWTSPGNYTYEITTSYGTFGPYTFGVDAAGSYQPTGLVTDVRTYGVSPYNTAAQNQTAFTSVQNAVNAGLTPAHIYVPGPPEQAVTAYSISSNIITVNVANSYSSGNTVLLREFGTSNFLNNQYLTVASANATQFTASFTHSNTSATEAGIAVPVYNVLSTGGTGLGTYNIAVDFECDTPDTTIINQTGTGNLIQPGPSGYVEFTTANFWTPSFIRKCQFTGGSSANAGVFYPGGTDGLVLDFDYFYNWGNSTNWAILTTGSNELELHGVSYLRTDQVLGNFLYQPFQFYDITLIRDVREVCTTSITNGASVACGQGITTDGDLEVDDLLASGPVPAIRCLGNAGATKSNTCSIKNSLIEGTGGNNTYSIEFGTQGSCPAGEMVYNISVNNVTATLASAAGAGFIGPANACVGVSNSDFSNNHGRADNISTQPMVTLNNVTGQTNNQGIYNVNFPSLHTAGTNINNWYGQQQFFKGNVLFSDNGVGSAVSWPVNYAADNFANITALSSSWTVLGGAFTVSGGNFSGNSAGFSTAYFNAGTPPANQYSQAEITVATTGPGEIGVGVRLQSGSNSGYVFACDLTPECGIYKVTSGSRTLLGALVPSSGFIVGDMIAISAVGTTITGYYNNGAVATVTDSTYANGFAGIWANSNTGNIKGGSFSFGSLASQANPTVFSPGPSGTLIGLGVPTFAIGAAAGSGASNPTIVTSHDCDSISCQFLFTSGNTQPTSGTFFVVTFNGITGINVRNCHVDVSNDTTGVPLPVYTYTGTTGANPTLNVLYAGTTVATTTSYRGQYICGGH